MTSREWICLFFPLRHSGSAWCGRFIALTRIRRWPFLVFLSVKRRRRPTGVVRLRTLEVAVRPMATVSIGPPGRQREMEFGMGGLAIHSSVEGAFSVWVYKLINFKLEEGTSPFSTRLHTNPQPETDG